MNNINNINMKSKTQFQNKNTNKINLDIKKK